MERKWLSDLRGDLTQEEIANASGISRSSYANIENGIRNPSVEVAKRIANILHFNWVNFFEEK